MISDALPWADGARIWDLRVAHASIHRVARSRLFYYILLHSYIPRPLPEHLPSLHFQRAHRFADARAFVMLLYLDAHHTFPHCLCCVLLILFHIYFAFMFQTIPFILCHMLTYILHTNYDTQSSYKTVELLCTTYREEYTPL